jgi:hypothetical protein
MTSFWRQLPLLATESSHRHHAHPRRVFPYSYSFLHSLIIRSQTLPEPTDITNRLWRAADELLCQRLSTGRQRSSTSPAPRLDFLDRVWRPRPAGGSWEPAASATFLGPYEILRPSHGTALCTFHCLFRSTKGISKGISDPKKRPRPLVGAVL